MSAPKRIQLSRAKGWRLPPNTVNVARPSRWGNPFRVLNEEGFPLIEGPDRTCHNTPETRWETVRAEVVALFRQRALDTLPSLEPLRGRDLACWCPPGSPCHADVLIELANAPLRCEAADG